jgi:signal transduction histidine kinase
MSNQTEPSTARSRPAPARDLPRHVAVILLLWATAVALVFGLYALVELIWLQDAAQATRDVGHLVRGIGASLVTTLVTAYYLLRRVVPSLERGLESDAAFHGAHRTEALAAWLIGLRWVAVMGLVVGLEVAIRGTGRVPAEAAPALWSGVGVLAVFNGVLTTLGPRRLASERSFLVQVTGDVLVLAWILHHAGGLANPFAGLFVFHAVIGAVVLSPTWARRSAMAIGALVLLQAAVEASGLLPPGCLRGADGMCTFDPTRLTASGLAVVVLVAGCSLLVARLVRALHEERDRFDVARRETILEREKLQTIIDCMADAVLFVTPAGELALRNRASNRLWSSGRAPESIAVCHDDGTWRAIVERISTTDHSDLHPILSVADRHYEATYAPVPDAIGGLAGLVMVARDVTERIQAQQWRMQQERMAVVGQLAAALAHELNNPLGTIALFSQHALKSVDRDHALAEHLEVVHRNANLCKKIVHDLLEYARQRPPELAELKVDALLDEVARTLTAHAAQQGVSVDLDVAEGLPGIHADADQLRQLFMNLGLNAIDAAGSGGRVWLRADRPRVGGRMRVEVSDTGPGIPPAEQPRIFSAFYTTKAKGTGLGLTVARDIALAHGGDLTMESRNGSGATFVLSLPVEPRVPPETSP